MPEVPSALPGWLRPRAAAVLATWFGRTLLRCVSGLLHVQIFDRAMTLAAQAFTSIFPLLIMLGTLLSAKQTSEFADLLEPPVTSKRLFSEALGDQGVGSFGPIQRPRGAVSATGLARAMVRAYAIIWDVGKVRSGPAAAGRWLLTVLLLSAFVIIGKLTAAVHPYLPLPGTPGQRPCWPSTGAHRADPMLLLGGAAPARLRSPAAWSSHWSRWPSDRPARSTCRWR